MKNETINSRKNKTCCHFVIGESERRSCVKIEVDVLGSLFLIVLMASVDISNIWRGRPGVCINDVMNELKMWPKYQVGQETTFSCFPLITNHHGCALSVQFEELKYFCGVNINWPTKVSQQMEILKIVKQIRADLCPHFSSTLKSNFHSGEVILIVSASLLQGRWLFTVIRQRHFYRQLLDIAGCREMGGLDPDKSFVQIQIKQYHFVAHKKEKKRKAHTTSLENAIFA